MLTLPILWVGVFQTLPHNDSYNCYTYAIKESKFKIKWDYVTLNFRHVTLRYISL